MQHHGFGESGGGMVFGPGKLGDFTEEGQMAYPAEIGNLFPNPAADHVVIPLTIPKHNELVRLYMFDNSGRLVRHFMVQGYGSINVESDISDLGAGMYFYNFEVDGVNVGTRKLLINK